MITQTNYPVSSVYPGEYEPLPLDTPELTNALSEAGFKQLPVNTHEFSGHYKIEIAMPGFKREDFTISTEDHVLCVRAINTSDSIKAMVKLPLNTDPEFVSATYKDGILGFCFFKSIYPGEIHKTRIAVY